MEQAMSMTDLIVHILRPLVEHPDAISVTCNHEGAVTHVIVCLAPDDHQQLISFRSRIARAIRTTLQAAVGHDSRLVLELTA